MNKRDVFLVIVIAAVVGVVSSLVTSNVMVGPPTDDSRTIIADDSLGCGADEACEGNLFKTESFGPDGDQAQFSGFEAKHSYFAMPISYSLSKIDGQSIAMRRYGGNDFEKSLISKSILTPSALFLGIPGLLGMGFDFETNIDSMGIQIKSGDWSGPDYETIIDSMGIQATYLARESEDDDSVSFACLDADGKLFRSDTLC